ncbi:dienelactone hydrolase family protein [Portibacter marinus]|uniref:dienelactone hydrolase family protein n=1 Tax=Portibacter marinus TaxID=2898660 RepID=UPI001F2FF49B|nr:dienelactone hydrolase family protein [Portibacter marinus]
MKKTQKIEYKDHLNTFEGVISYDDVTDQKRPVILIAHTFKGQSQFEIDKAIELAKSGYIGFAIDMYGKGKRAENAEDARKLMHELTEDRPLLLKRMELVLKIAKALKQGDENRIGAIGFCFGGKCILDLEDLEQNYWD